MSIWQIILIIIVALIGLFVLYLKALPKGAAGEFAAKLVIRFLGKEYRSVHNFTFNDGEKTVQIDHLIISPYGIFVVETKNYSGKIYGNENSDKFIQYLGKNKYEFYSPIKQNRGHIYSLKNVLGDNKYISIIAFSGMCKIKVQSETFVGYIGQINKYIKSYKDIILDKYQVDNLYEKITNISLKGYKVHKEHVKNIKQRIQDFNDKVDNRICPKCDGKLVERQGSYGKFLGCSNYPKCKFKKNI